VIYSAATAIVNAIDMLDIEMSPYKHGLMSPFRHAMLIHDGQVWGWPRQNIMMALNAFYRINEFKTAEGHSVKSGFRLRNSIAGF